MIDVTIHLQGGYTYKIDERYAKTVKDVLYGLEMLSYRAIDDVDGDGL